MSLNKVDTMQRAYKRADAYTDGNWVDETNFNRHLYGSFRSSCCEVTAGGAHIPPTQKHAGRVLIGNWVEDSIPSQNGTARNILTNGWNVDTPPPTSTYRDSYKGPDTSSMTAQSLRERVLGVRAQQRLENVIEKSREHGHLDLAAQRERCQSTLSETHTTSFGETFGRRSRAGFDATKELPAVAPVFTYQTDQAITCAKQNPNCGCVMKVQGTTVPSREADFVKNVSFTTPPQITIQRRVI